MGYAITALIAAIAVSIAVYGTTSSFILAFLAYSAAGTMTLLLSLAAAAFVPGPIESDD